MSLAELTEQDRELIETVFANPILVSSFFKNWMIDQVALNIPQLPVGQALGGRGIERYLKTDTTSATASDAAVNEMFTFKIPGKTLAQAGELHILHVWKAMCTDGSNSFDIDYKLNGTTFATHSRDTSVMDAQYRPGADIVRVINLGDYSNQLFWIDGAYQGDSANPFSGINTIAHDFSQDVTFSIDYDWSSDGTNELVKHYVALSVFNPIGKD